MKKTTWNTFRLRGYSYDVANDQASAGGVHLHQVRKTAAGWQKRIEQSNGAHSAFSEVRPITDAEGEAAFATARTRK